MLAPPELLGACATSARGQLCACLEHYNLLHLLAAETATVLDPLVENLLPL